MNLSSPLTLCYHGVSNTWDNALAVRPNAFEQQIRFLLRRRWRPATAQQVISGSGRLLHVTFDDAFTSILPSLVALRTLAVPATVFACSGYAEDGGRVFDVPELAAAAQTVPDELQTLGWDGLRDLAEAGVEIGSHTSTHPHLTRLSDVELDGELRASREQIADELGRPCVLLAYPYGEENARVRAAARRAGYEAAFALPGSLRDRDPFAVPRVGIYRVDTLARLWAKSSSAIRTAVELKRRA